MARIHYPRAWVQVHLRLDDFGQPDPERLITLPHPPIELTVEENAWYEADTFTAVVDLEDFPLDPRIIRGITFEAFMADADGLDPEFWIRQSQDEFRSHAIFAGVVDEVSSDIDDDWRRTTLKGRDYTAYFLDIETDGKPVSYMSGNHKSHLLGVIRKIQKQIPNAAELSIVPDADVPDLYPADYHTRGTDEKVGSRKKRHGESAWEAISELCLEGGLIPYIRLDEIRIRRPSTIFVDQGQDDSHWFVWTFGENLKRLNTHRNMGRQHGINVRVTSHCPDGDGGEKIRHAIWPNPPLAARETPASALTDEEGKQATPTPTVKFTPYVVRGISDQAQLQEIAHQLHDLLRHHELEGEFETDDLADSNGRSVFDMHYGDPVVFDFSEAFHSLLSLDRREQVQRLLEIGYGRETAESVARALNSNVVPFYVHKLTHRFTSDEDGGYSLRAEIRSRKQVNYTLDADGNVVKDAASEGV